MYKYDICGLDNVFLKNGYQEHVTPYGKGVSFHNLDGLHRTIAQTLIERRLALSGAEFRFLRTELDLSQAGFGVIVGKSEQAVAIWEKQDKVPKDADLIIRALYRDRMEGNAKLGDMVERFAHLDRQRVHAEITLEQARNGRWKQAA